MPHFEWRGCGNITELRKKYPNPEDFKATWKTNTKEEDYFMNDVAKAAGIGYEDAVKRVAELIDWDGDTPHTDAATIAEFEAARAAGITDGTNPNKPMKRWQGAIMAKRASGK
jgi:hypothetical protein